jgi:hypothetical protein
VFILNWWLTLPGDAVYSQLVVDTHNWWGIFSTAGGYSQPVEYLKICWCILYRCWIFPTGGRYSWLVADIPS